MHIEETHRKRMRRYEHDGRARFVTFSTYRRLPLFLKGAIKDRFAEHLELARRRDRFALFAWVVMPEHVHLILWPREVTVSRTLLVLKRTFAREVLRRWRDLNAPILSRLQDDQGRLRFWQRGGGYDRNIRDRDELQRKIAYVNENPVRRGLVDRATEWEWSSARWCEGDRRGMVKLDHWS